VIDEFQVLLAGNDPMATEAVALLESLARKGRSYGIHLILASQTVLGVEALYAKRDSIFGQFPVRIALPGGGDVLEPTNDSAAGLPLGTGGGEHGRRPGRPRGATRGHERRGPLPRPARRPPALSDLRHKLWGARDPEAVPPRIFAGYAIQHLADDPTYRAALAGPGRPPALGRPGHRRQLSRPRRSRWTPRRDGTWPSSVRTRPAPRCWTPRPAASPRSTPPRTAGSSSPRWWPRETSSPRRWPSRSATGRRWRS
jgi:hypothetical protein